MFFKVLIQYLESLRLSDIIIIITAFYIIYKNNVQMLNIQKIVLGRTKKSPLVLSLYKIIIGSIGGVFVSYLVQKKEIYFNSYIQIQGILFLTVLGFVSFLSFIDISITSMVLIIFSLSFNSSSIVTQDIVSLYYLISFLLIAEGIIFILDNKVLSLPIFKKIDNKIYGGYKIKDFYFMFLFLAFIPGSKNYLLSFVILLSGVFFKFDESVFSFSKKWALKVKGFLRLGTGIILHMGTELLSSRGDLVLIIILLFPFLIKGEKYLFKQIDLKRKAKFKSEKEYKMILEVRENSNGYKSGLRAGDKIIKINGEEKPGYLNIIKKLQGSSGNEDVRITIINKYNKEKTIDLKIDSKESSGIIIVPEESEIVTK